VAGKYSAYAAAECDLCEEGKYSAEDESTTCTSCLSGTVQPAEGQTSCNDCATGKAQLATGQTGCVVCEAGKYAASTGSSLCTECSTGKYQNVVEQSACTSCAAGMYAGQTGLEHCDACEPSEFTSAEGSFACSLCLYPYTTYGSNRTSCGACERNFYWLTKSQQDGKNCEGNGTANGNCCPCPEGFECGDSDPKERFVEKVRVTKGFYRTTESSQTPYDCSQFHKYGDHCEGEANGDKSCKQNSEGPLCALCKDNYFHRSDGDLGCMECTTKSVTGTLIPVIIIFAVLLLAVAAWKADVFPKFQHKFEAWAHAHSFNIDWWAITVRIIFFDYQIISKFSEMQNVTWPMPFSGYLSLLDLMFLDFASWFPGLECTEWTTYGTLVVWTIAPICLWAVALSINVFRAIAAELVREDGTEISLKSMKRALLPTIETTTSYALNLVSLIHTLICVKIFTIFDCDEFEHSRHDETGVVRNEKFLATDYSLSCESDKYEFYKNYGIMMCIIYVGFIPAGMAWTMKRHITAGADTTHRLLDMPYKKTCRWLDCVNI
jgi:hypothetical protein